MSALGYQKSKLRGEALAHRRQFREDHPEADSQLCAQIQTLLKKLKTKDGIWVSYRAVRSEANPEAAVQELGGSWAYPRMHGEALEFYLIDKNSTWELGPSGISEPNPQSSKRIDIHQAEGILIPGLMFDPEGTRLGSGRAFYDRALAEFSGHRVGVAYSVQVRNENLPSESHDVRMGFIVTEKQISEVKGNQ